MANDVKICDFYSVKTAEVAMQKYMDDGWLCRMTPVFTPGSMVYVLTVVHPKYRKEFIND